MGEQADLLKARTRQFALDVFAVVRQLSRDEPGATIRRQLTKSATAVSANYRAACRARSHQEFVARLGVVSEEADESEHWLDLIVAARLLDTAELKKLHREVRELVAIFSASYATSKRSSRRAL